MIRSLPLPVLKQQPSQESPQRDHHFVQTPHSNITLASQAPMSQFAAASRQSFRATAQRSVASRAACDDLRRRARVRPAAARRIRDRTNPRGADVRATRDRAPKAAAPRSAILQKELQTLSYRAAKRMTEPGP